MGSSSPFARESQEHQDRPDALAIEAEGLSFSYGGRKALDDVSFAIARGEIFGFLGPNGGGKTTLFKVLSTLAPVESGRAVIMGRDLSAATVEIRRRMGVVFQHPSVDGKLTVEENIRHHGHLYGLTGPRLTKRCNATLERFGLGARAGDLVETLSGGMRRRVELAKTLVHEPDLMLLDEPTTGLDPMARHEFMGLLGELHRQGGVTVVLTTHNMDEAERCGRIAMLHQGRLVAIAPPGELKSRVGGDVIVIHSAAPEALRQKLSDRLSLAAAVVDGSVRIERPRGHELVGELVEMFGGEIESLTFGKPTLEDVFVDLTGHKFAGDEPEGTQ
jgi:ABC-2 type transport system ATP-binding protein